MGYGKGGTYGVVHIGSALNQNRSRVGELGPGDVLALVLSVRAVVDFPGRVVDEAGGAHPVPGRLGGLGVRIVARELGQAGAEREEACVGEGWGGMLEPYS